MTWDSNAWQSCSSNTAAWWSLLFSQWLVLIFLAFIDHHGLWGNQTKKIKIKISILCKMKSYPWFCSHLMVLTTNKQRSRPCLMWREWERISTDTPWTGTWCWPWRKLNPQSRCTHQQTEMTALNLVLKRKLGLICLFLYLSNCIGGWTCL